MDPVPRRKISGPTSRRLCAEDRASRANPMRRPRRPGGITDLEVKSALKKFKDKRFAAKCDREVILKGCGLLGMELPEVMALTIAGMQKETQALGLGPKESS